MLPITMAITLNHFRAVTSVGRLTTLAALFLAAISSLAQEQPPAGDKPEPKLESAPPPLSLTIEGDVDDDMAPIAGRLTTLFYECYPKLLERFENEDKFAARKIMLVFKKGIKVPG